MSACRALKARASASVSSALSRYASTRGSPIRYVLMRASMSGACRARRLLMRF